MKQELKEKYFHIYGKRFSKREKSKFQSEIIKDYQALGYDGEVISSRARFSKVRNIYIGNPKQAKVAYVIPYNTPAKVFWYKNVLYPHDGYYNMKKLFIPTYLPMFIAYALLLALVYVLPNFVGPTVLTVVYPLCFLYVFFLVWFILHGFKNKYNAVNNSAAIVLALSLAQDLPASKRRDAMFIFTDGNKPSSALGNDGVMKYLLEHNKANLNLISLYCLGRGNEVQLLSDRFNKNLAKDFQKRWNSDLKLHVRSINDTDKNNTVIEKLPHAMLFSSGELFKDILRIDGVATSKDRDVEDFIIDDMYTLLLDYMNKNK